MASFNRAVAKLGAEFELKLWRDAPSMIAERESYFPTAALISLDHDLNTVAGTTADPGTGLDVARFLGDFKPVCPALVHSSNTDLVYSMHNELRFAGWMVDRVGPIDRDWIETSWAKRVRQLLSEYPNTWEAQLPSDHQERVARMRLSLDGLGLGAYFADDLGSCAEEARASALVTHTHPEGVAGAVAVAVAAGMAWQLKDSLVELPSPLFDAVLQLTPESEVRRKLLLASTTPAEVPVDTAVLRTAAGSVRNQDRGLIFQTRDGFAPCGTADSAGAISVGSTPRRRYCNPRARQNPPPDT